MAGIKGKGWRTEKEEAAVRMFCQRSRALFRSQWDSMEGIEAEDGMFTFTFEIDHSVSRGWNMRGEVGSRWIGELR